MNRSERSRKFKESGQRLEAEDRVFSYLVNNYPPHIYRAVAVRVEWFLAMRLEHEQNDMIERGDQREGVWIGSYHMDDVNREVAKTPPRLSDLTVELHVIGMLSEFPIDRAWWIAHRVARQVAVWLPHSLRPGPKHGALANYIKQAATEAVLKETNQVADGSLLGDQTLPGVA